MLKPIGDRVLIKPEAQPQVSDGGLHLVEHWKPEVTGTVAAVPDRVPVRCRQCEADLSRPCEVQPGDYVVFSWADGQEVFIDDDRYILMRESDIKAVVELEDV